MKFPLQIIPHRGLHLPKVSLPKPLPFRDGFLLDSRPAGERKIINPAWYPKNRSDPLRIEMIDRKDFDLIGQFFTDHFARHANVCRALNTTYSELEAFCFEFLATFIDKPLSFAAFDEDKLVAIKLNNYHTFDEFPEMFKGKISDPNAKFEMKEDYGEDASKTPYSSEKSNYVYVLLKDGIGNTGKFLPKGTKKLGFLEATGIHPQYMGSGLIQYLYGESLQIFDEHNCDHFVSYCVATGTYKVGQKIGMKQAFSYPYAKFKVNGEVIYKEKMYDGATDFRVLIGNTKECLKNINSF